MCRPVTCTTCKKTTWAGCGQHVAQVKATVPAGQWCSGHSRSASHEAKAAQDSRSLSGWLGRLLGR